MKADRRPKEKIDSLPDTPIEIKPFDPQSKAGALHYAEKLNELLAPLGVQAELFGSVALEIAGKGEWEYAIYPADEQWYAVLVALINHFGSIHFLRADMAVFTSSVDEQEIEVIPMRGETAKRNQAIMDFWRSEPEALQEYERGKLEHAFSKRAYYRWKDEHIAGIVERL